MREKNLKKLSFKEVRSYAKLITIIKKSITDTYNV